MIKFALRGFKPKRCRADVAEHLFGFFVHSLGFLGLQHCLLLERSIAFSFRDFLLSNILGNVKLAVSEFLSGIESELRFANPILFRVLDVPSIFLL